VRTQKQNKHLETSEKINGGKDEFPTNGSTGQREKAPAVPNSRLQQYRLTDKGRALLATKNSN